MTARDETYFKVRFKEDRIDFRWPGDKTYFEKFCRRHSGETGYIIVCRGEIEKSVRQLRFFYGPLIDAFIRLTGNTDRDRWKDYLKQNFLDRDSPDEIPSLADVSMKRMADFITRCLDHLADQGGYLDSYEKRLADELTAD